MINLKLINKILGSLLYIEANLMLVCLLVSVYYQETDLFGFLIAFILTVMAAAGLRYHGRDAKNTLSRRDAYVVVSLTWVIFSLMGTLPFLVSGYINSFTDAFFEAMAGFTTTGSSILSDVERCPHGLLLWRTISQWIGGLGIVFFTIALLPSLVGGPTRVFAAEATGPIRTKLHPKLSTTAKWIWSIYILLTIACVGSYALCGMQLFDAINNGMTTTATGGFTTHNDINALYSTPALQYLCILFCFLSGINFTLLYFSISKLRFKAFWRNAEFRFYLLLILGCTLVIGGLLFFRGNYNLEHAFRSSLFQVVSFVTSTGLFFDDTAAWPQLAWILLLLCMIIGGCSGSTSGGIKGIRVVLLLKNLQNEFRQMIHPNAVLPLRIDQTNMPHGKRFTLLAFLTAYLLIALVAGGVLMSTGVDSSNALTIIIGCMGNVGPSLNLNIGPATTWAELPTLAKWVSTALMLVGRLEIFSVLILFSPRFWQKN